MIHARCTLFIDVLVLSEYINRYARLEYYRGFKQSYSEFKQFRDSSDFIPVATTISVTGRKIVRMTSRVDSGFSTLNINTILHTYGKGKADFNDQILIDICRRRNLTLVTHDGDFADKDVAILTANTRLLK